MYEIGTMTDFDDALTKLDAFMTTNGSAYGVSYAGTGTGVISGWRGGASSVAETFEITATSATNFTVVGSVSGSIGPATVGTPFAHAKLAFLLTAGGTAFVAGDKFTLATAPKATRMRGRPTSNVTRWRINVAGNSSASSTLKVAALEMMTSVGGADQCTGGTPSMSTTTGSNTADKAFDGSGATIAEFVGQSGWLEYQFASAKTILQIAITAPNASPLNAPKDFTVEAWNGTSWVPCGSFRNEDGWAAAERRIFTLTPFVWKLLGNDGVSEILVGVQTMQNNGAGSYNWRLNGFTAYDAAAEWFNLPGAIAATPPYGPMVPLHNTSMAYWFVNNGRHIKGVIKCGAVYSPFYLGLIQPYASQGQWPLPIFVGGSLWFATEPTSTSANYLVGTAHGTHTCYALPNYDLIGGFDPDTIGHRSSAVLRRPDGAWRGFHSRSAFYDPHEEFLAVMHPYSHGFKNVKPNLDGSYHVRTITLVERLPDNWWGNLDNVRAVTGSGLSAEATLTIGRDTWVAFPDCTRSAPGDFFAMKLD